MPTLTPDVDIEHRPPPPTRPARVPPPVRPRARRLWFVLLTVGTVVDAKTGFGVGERIRLGLEDYTVVGLERNQWP